MYLNRAILVLGAILFTACGTPAGDNPAPDPKTATLSLDTTGGTVKIAGDIELVIPANALSSAVDITINEVKDSDPGHSPRSSVYEFLPEGLVFNAPVTVRIPFTGSASDAVLYWSHAGAPYVEMGGAAEGAFWVAEVSSFSRGFVGTTTPSQCAGTLHQDDLAGVIGYQAQNDFDGPNDANVIVYDKGLSNWADWADRWVWCARSEIDFHDVLASANGNASLTSGTATFQGGNQSASRLGSPIIDVAACGTVNLSFRHTMNLGTPGAPAAKANVYLLDGANGACTTGLWGPDATVATLSSWDASTQPTGETVESIDISAQLPASGQFRLIWEMEVVDDAIAASWTIDDLVVSVP